MRLAPIVVGTLLAAGVASAQPAQVDDNATHVAVTPAKLTQPSKPAKADRKAEAKKLAAIAVEPNEYTNDPVLGQATRVSGEEARGVVHFTFDDGPNPETTPAVLDALAKYDVPATFFVVTRRLAGKHGEKPREILARTIADGHLVASHSVTHRHLGKATGKTLDAELDASFKALSLAAKQPIGLFRAPFGALGGAGRARLKKLGVTEVFWSIDTLDWQAKDADKLRKKTLQMIVKQNGGVVLFHDVKQVTAEIIAGVLDDLEAENCKRLAAKQDPIVPVSLHYFLRDGKKARAVPEAVTKRTDAYKQALPGRCAKRPAPAPIADPKATPAAKPAP